MCVVYHIKISALDCMRPRFIAADYCILWNKFHLFAVFLLDGQAFFTLNFGCVCVTHILLFHFLSGSTEDIIIIFDNIRIRCEILVKLTLANASAN